MWLALIHRSDGAWAAPDSILRLAQNDKTKKPPAHIATEAESDRGSCEVAYLACANFEACALAREAAFLWTTPDFVALSIAEL